MNDKIKLKDACKILNGFAFKSGKYVDSGIRIIRIANVQKGYVEDERPAFYPNSEESSIRDYMLEEDDLLLSLTGNVGRVALLDKRWLPAALNQRVACLRIKDDRIIKDYLYFALLSDKFENDCTESSKGIAQKNMSTEWLKDYEIPLPGVQKQREIASSLKQLSMIIKNKTEQIQQLDILIKARFVEMFGVPGANSKGWNEIKLGEVCSLQNGYAFKSSDYINKSGVLNCRMSNIRPDGGFDAEYHPKYLPEEYWDKCSGYRLFDGDVIIAMTDMASDPKILGVPTIVSTNGKKFLLNQRVGKLSFLHDDRMNRVYLMHSLGQKYIRKELAKSAAGSTQINVGKPAILNINIYDPPRSLQDQFATFVAQVDKSKFAVQKSLEKTQLLFDSLMQEYFD